MSRISNAHSISIVSSQSSLAALASGMSAGSWATFTMGNLTSQTFACPGSTSTPSYLNGNAARLVWDRTHQKMSIYGCSHTGGAFIANAGGWASWDDTTNQWATSERYTWSSEDPGHPYYNITCNPTTGDLYIRNYGAGTIRRRLYGAASGAASWINFSTLPSFYQYGVAAGLEFFPDLNGGTGGLVFSDWEGVKYTTNAALTSWTSATGSVTGMGELQSFIGYTPGSQRVYFGGGNVTGGFSRKMFALSSTGAITSKADTPVNAGACPSFGHSPIFPHPNGVDLMLYGPFTNGDVYKYSGSGNAWTSAGTHQIGSSDGIWAGCTIPEYGVIVFIINPGGAGTPVCKVHKPA